MRSSTYQGINISVIAGFQQRYITQHLVVLIILGTDTTAARLEAHTKACAVPILFDAETQAGLGADVTCAKLDDARFKGFSDPVSVFGVG